ncbi:MAG: hypothetical protein AAF611_07920 [Bacteroidota bacterium]
MIKVNKFLKDHETKLPASFKHAEFSSVEEGDEVREISKLSQNDHYQTNAYNVIPFYKDIVRYL